jgi:hypothetical protein
VTAHLNNIAASTASPITCLTSIRVAKFGKRLPRGPLTKLVIYAALGLPHGGTLDFPDTPQALVVVDNRQSGPPSHRHPGRWDSVPEIAPANPLILNSDSDRLPKAQALGALPKIQQEEAISSS